jgi:hypothetical protein
MGRHAESPGVQEEAAAALGNLALDDENQRMICAQVANAHEHICALPEENVAIGNRNDTHSHTHSLTQGGIEVLVAAMGRHAESPGVQEQAAGALRNLAGNHPENQRKIGAQVANAHEHTCALPEENVAIGNRKHTHSHTHSLTQGGIEALVTAMGRHAESPDVQEQAAGALGNLCNLADRFSDLQQRIKRAGAGEAVRCAMAAPGATADTKTWGQKVLDALKILF